MKIVIAPSGFKESLSSEQAADAIAEGIGRICADEEIVKVPLADGGEGFTKTLIETAGGKLREIEVTGAVGEPVTAHYGVFENVDGVKVGVVEMAAAAGLSNVPKDQRNPLNTTTYGVGELIKAVLDEGVERILLGCGDSGTNDGGAGMAQALGVKLLKADGEPIERKGAGLKELDSIDLSERDERLENVKFEVACNIKNILCGEKGVARVFGPQKGASPE